MPYSRVVDGKVLDVTSKRPYQNYYVVYLGDMWIGQIFKLRNGYSIVSRYVTEFGNVAGLATKYHCYDRLLEIYDKYGKESRE